MYILDVTIVATIVNSHYINHKRLVSPLFVGGIPVIDVVLCGSIF